MRPTPSSGGHPRNAPPGVGTVNGELKVKKDWKIKKLGDVCEINIGRTPERGNSKMWDKEKKTENVWLSIADLNNAEDGYISDSSEYVSDNAVPKMKLVKANTLLMSFKLTIGRCAITKRELFTNEAIAALPIIDKDLDLFFLKYYLENFDWAKLTEGDVKVKGKTLNKEKLKEVPITVPPREEQKRIVKILDEKIAQLETIKTNAQTNLQNAKDLFQSQLTKAFSNTTWEKAKLEDIALDFSRGKSKHRPRNDKCLFGGDYPFIQTGDIRNADKYVTDYTETYNETGLAQSKLWQKGTLCITIAANIAETAILSFPCCFPDSVIGFIPNEKLTTVDFVYYLIQFFKSELQKMSKGAAQDNLNLAKFENMNFPLPPLPEQKRIVEQLDSLSEKTKALQNIYEQMLLDCEELKQSFLCKAFAGEL